MFLSFLRHVNILTGQWRRKIVMKTFKPQCRLSVSMKKMKLERNINVKLIYLITFFDFLNSYLMPLEKPPTNYEKPLKTYNNNFNKFSFIFVLPDYFKKSWELPISTTQKYKLYPILFQKPQLKFMIRAFFSLESWEVVQTFSNTSPKRLQSLDWIK